jgi:hypothetical protein
MPVFGVVAVMLVMVVLLLAVRCSNEKYVQEQDIEIEKLTLMVLVPGRKP